MKTEIITIESNRGARCRLCSENNKIKKGEKALKITIRPLTTPYVGETNVFYCIPHARDIQINMSKLDI